MVRDDRLGPPEVRGYDGLGVVYLLQDALVLTPWTAVLDMCPRANWIGFTNGLDGFDPLGY
jgi:hypothetical protein